MLELNTLTEPSLVWRIEKSEEYEMTAGGVIPRLIYSVIRLEDNVEFEIGDLILEQREVSKILWFRQVHDHMMIRIYHTVTRGYSTIMMGTSQFEKVPTQINIIENIEVANFS